ncbi:hypothetical protein [Paracoccus sp. N5]|uniref:hypothetical protein n=1 Tax=Paracoccus sp. N5 TaxID=1101189 RepID=UPI00039B7A6A|nr:hypothetical protein [Paracoccus sp. N5]
MRLALVSALLILALTGIARAEAVLFPAPSGQAAGELTIYSSLDDDLARPLVEAFSSAGPTLPCATRTC